MNDIDLLRKSIDDRRSRIRDAGDLIKREQEAITREQQAIETIENLRKTIDTGMSLRDALESGTSLLEDAPGETVPKAHSFKSAMLGALNALNGGTFTSTEIIEKISQLYPDVNIEGNRSNVSAYLNDFREDNLITLVRGGSGRRPSKYRRK